MIIDVKNLSEWAGAIMTIWAVVGGIGFIIYRFTKRVKQLEDTVRKNSEDIEDSKEERFLSIEVSKTILEVVAQNKNNGNVEVAMNKIDNFLNKKAHE